MINAISTYTDRQLAKLTSDQAFEAIRQEAILQGVEPPTEVFAIDPPNFAYALKSDAKKVPDSALQVITSPTGVIAQPITLSIVSKWIDPQDISAFRAVYDSGLARYMDVSSADSATLKLVDKANKYLATANGDVLLAQTFWTAFETQPWPL